MQFRIAAVVVLSFIACTGAPPVVGPDESGAAQDALSATSPETFLGQLEGSWYGEVPGIYKACLTFTALEKTKPWQLQTLIARIGDGSDVIETRIDLSRNAFTNASAPVYFMNASTSSATALFSPGVYQLLDASKAKTEVRFIQFTSSVDQDVSLQSATGIDLSKNKNELTFAKFEGDLYCGQKGVGSLCGTGGFTPFVLTKKACPTF